MFSGRKICRICNTPQSTEGFDSESDVCTVCSRKHQEKQADYALLRDEGQPPENQFGARLRELQKNDPVITTVADRMMVKLAGAEGYADRAVEDFKHCRGEDMTEEQKKLHTVNQGALTKWHGIIIELMKMRDAMVGDYNAMSEMEEDDLQAIVSQGAVIRLEMDSEFRMEMFQAILRKEPEIANRMMDMLPSLVVDHGPANPDTSHTEPSYDAELDLV